MEEREQGQWVRVLGSFGPGVQGRGRRPVERALDRPEVIRPFFITCNLIEKLGKNYFENVILV